MAQLESSIGWSNFVWHMTTNLTDFLKDVEQEMFTDDCIIHTLNLQVGARAICRQLWSKGWHLWAGSKA
jgi:hypothetical protein